jgi:hypothetical protein
MELVVLVFDLTMGREAGDALRLAALEIPRQIASGAMDGPPRSWPRSLELARDALDRLEAEAKALWGLQDRRLTELVARVRGELETLERAAREPSVEVALDAAA